MSRRPRSWAPGRSCMAIPTKQLAHASDVLRFYCAGVPERVRHLVEHTFRVERDAIVLVSRRPRFDDPTEWSSDDIAKFRFVKTRGVWVLYWPDRHSRWHEYEFLAPSRKFEVLLKEVERDPTGIFWG